MNTYYNSRFSGLSEKELYETNGGLAPLAVIGIIALIVVAGLVAGAISGYNEAKSGK